MTFIPNSREAQMIEAIAEALRSTSKAIKDAHGDVGLFVKGDVLRGNLRSLARGGGEEKIGEITTEQHWTTSTLCKKHVLRCAVYHADGKCDWDNAPCTCVFPQPLDQPVQFSPRRWRRLNDLS